MSTQRGNQGNPNLAKGFRVWIILWGNTKGYFKDKECQILFAKHSSPFQFWECIKEHKKIRRGPFWGDAPLPSKSSHSENNSLNSALTLRQDIQWTNVSRGRATDQAKTDARVDWLSDSPSLGQIWLRTLPQRELLLHKNDHFVSKQLSIWPCGLGLVFVFEKTKKGILFQDKSAVHRQRRVI